MQEKRRQKTHAASPMENKTFQSDMENNATRPSATKSENLPLPEWHVSGPMNDGRERE